jgi:hypothetical protein
VGEPSGAFDQQYTWTIPTGDAVGTTKSLNLSANQILAPGSYTYQVTALDLCKNEVTKEITIEVSPLPTVKASPELITSCPKEITIEVSPLPTVKASPELITSCPGEPVTLTATGADTYTWLTIAGEQVGTGSSIQVNPHTPTQYVVIGGDKNGCENTDNVQINMYAPLVITASEEKIICKNEAVRLIQYGK